MTYVVQFWLNGDALVGETIHEQDDALPKSGDVVELGDDGSWYSVQSVDAPPDLTGDVSFVLAMVTTSEPPRHQQLPAL